MFKEIKVSTRVSPGRPFSVSHELILTTAIQIVDEEGADALTLRRLAKSMNSGTATLYRNFESREALIAQVVDRLFAEMEASMPEVAGLGWKQACRMLANHMFTTLRRHRGAAQLLIKAIPNGPNAMIQRERSLAILLNNGFSAPLAARAYATLARYVLGFAIQFSDNGASGEDDAKQAEAFHRLDWSAFPATLFVIGELPLPLDEEFSFGLDLMIYGLSELRKNDSNK
jgi:TetR/AcrR family tetracycline transcriptional repressor